MRQHYECDHVSTSLQMHQVKTNSNEVSSP